MDVIHLALHNEDAAAERVVSLLMRGGVAAVPTDTVYGLVADIGRDQAIRKIFRIKARSFHKALPMFVRDIAAAKAYAYIEPKVEKLLSELWPGQTTVVLPKRDGVPDLVTGGAKSVAIRIPDHSFLARLLAMFPRPLTGTSANLSGSEPAQSAVEVQTVFSRHVPRPELIVDAGTLPNSPSSTVLDLTNPKNPKILRMGAITKERLDEVLSSMSTLR